MKFFRIWAMPNKNTFSILPIKELIQHYINKEKIWIDPFANQSIFNSYCHFTNDLNLEFPTTHHLDALDFLKSFKTQTIDGILFDPPYSVRQLSECYKGLGIAVTQETTRPNFWTDIKNEITRIIKPNGIIISCGWNSGGIGKELGFEIIEILLVPHGGIHNDTIITVERKNGQKTLI